jgi:hypothetical protein
MDCHLADDRRRVLVRLAKPTLSVMTSSIVNDIIGPKHAEAHHSLQT